MTEDHGPYQEGKRAGLHPLIVVFGVLLGLWLFVALIVPSSRNKQATGTEGPTGPLIEDPEAAPVIFKVQSTVSDMNAVSLVVTGAFEPPTAGRGLIQLLVFDAKDGRTRARVEAPAPAT